MKFEEYGIELSREHAVQLLPLVRTKPCRSTRPLLIRTRRTLHAMRAGEIA